MRSSYSFRKGPKAEKQREGAMGVSLKGRKCRWGLWCRTVRVSAPISNASDGDPLLWVCPGLGFTPPPLAPPCCAPLCKPRMPSLDRSPPSCFHHTLSQGFPCTEICEEPSALQQLRGNEFLSRFPPLPSTKLPLSSFFSS